jgi:hypothetical protein
VLSRPIHRRRRPHVQACGLRACGLRSLQVHKDVLERDVVLILVLLLGRWLESAQQAVEQFGVGLEVELVRDLVSFPEGLDVLELCPLPCLVPGGECSRDGCPYFELQLAAVVPSAASRSAITNRASSLSTTAGGSG